MQTEKNKGNETFQEDLTKIGQEIKDKEDQITFMQKNNSAMLAENMRLKKLEKQIKGGHDAMKQFDKELNDWKSRAEKAEFDVKQLNSQIKHHASKRTSEVPFVNSGVPLEPEVKKKENQISLIAELANKNAGGTAGKELLKEKEDHQQTKDKLVVLEKALAEYGTESGSNLVSMEKLNELETYKKEVKALEAKLASNKEAMNSLRTQKDKQEAQNKDLKYKLKSVEGTPLLPSSSKLYLGNSNNQFQNDQSGSASPLNKRHTIGRTTPMHNKFPAPTPFNVNKNSSHSINIPTAPSDIKRGSLTKAVLQLDQSNIQPEDYEELQVMFRQQKRDMLNYKLKIRELEEELKLHINSSGKKPILPKGPTSLPDNFQEELKVLRQRTKELKLESDDYRNKHIDFENTIKKLENDKEEVLAKLTEYEEKEKVLSQTKKVNENAPAQQKIMMIGNMMANRMMKKTTDKKVNQAEERAVELLDENRALSEEVEDLKICIAEQKFEMKILEENISQAKLEKTQILKGDMKSINKTNEDKVKKLENDILTLEKENVYLEGKVTELEETILKKDSDTIKMNESHDQLISVNKKLEDDLKRLQDNKKLGVNSQSLNKK